MEYPLEEVCSFLISPNFFIIWYFDQQFFAIYSKQTIKFDCIHSVYKPFRSVHLRIGVNTFAIRVLRKPILQSRVGAAIDDGAPDHSDHVRISDG